MNSVKESLRNTIEVLSDEEARQILGFIQRLRTTSDVSPTLRRLASDPAFRVPSEEFGDFRVVEPIPGKVIPGISPTPGPGQGQANNVAERSLRSLVIARKICFGNYSEKGLVTTARLRTVVATARMRGVDVWDYLAHALVQYRSGQPAPLLDLSSG